MKTTNHNISDLSTLLRPVAADLEQVRECISRVLTEVVWPVGDLLSQLDLCGGKMLRPAMTLLGGKCLGSVAPEQIDLAAIMEMIHLASLLHDDVIDQAQARRGRRSANALWGNTQAVLLGDFVLSKAFALGTALHLPEASAILCKTAEAICTGEMRQNLQKGDWTITEADYLAVIEAKTASLFGTCCQLGALAGKAEPAMQTHLQQYGTAFGMLFQIADDLLDIFGDTNKEGKSLGADLFNEKLTLPVVHWLMQDRQQRQNVLKRLMQSADRATLRQTLHESGAVDYTLGRAEDYARIACAALAELPESDAKQSLLGLVAYVVGRVDVCRP